MCEACTGRRGKKEETRPVGIRGMQMVGIGEQEWLIDNGKEEGSRKPYRGAPSLGFRSPDVLRDSLTVWGSRQNQ